MEKIQTGYVTVNKSMGTSRMERKKKMERKSEELPE